MTDDVRQRGTLGQRMPTTHEDETCGGSLIQPTTIIITLQCASDEQ